MGQQVQFCILEDAVGTGGLTWALERAGGLPQLAHVLLKTYHEDSIKQWTRATTCNYLWQFGEAYGLLLKIMVLNASNKIHRVIKEANYIEV